MFLWILWPQARSCGGNNIFILIFDGTEMSGFGNRVCFYSGYPVFYLLFFHLLSAFLSYHYQILLEDAWKHIFWLSAYDLFSLQSFFVNLLFLYRFLDLQFFHLSVPETCVPQLIGIHEAPWTGQRLPASLLVFPKLSHKSPSICF